MISKFKIFENKKKNSDLDPYSEENWDENVLKLKQDKDNFGQLTLFVSKNYLNGEWDFNDEVRDYLNSFDEGTFPITHPNSIRALYFKLVDEGDPVEFDHGWLDVQKDKIKILQWG